MKDTFRNVAGIVAVTVFILFLAFACGPGWVEGDKRRCEAQGGQYINWRNEGHCYPAYTIPVTPTRGR